MKDELPTLVGALVSDMLSALGVPGSGVALSIQKLMERRLIQASDIALDELRKGNGTVDTIDIDHTVAMLFRYLRAAQEGAARLNLRLMAKVIAGQRMSATLTADEFLYHAEILASLRREEIILLSTLYKHWLKERSQNDRVTRNMNALQAAKKELVPHVLGSEDEFTGTMAAVTRTGLLIPGSAFGTLIYQISPLMDRLYALAPFDAALEEDELNEPTSGDFAPNSR